MRVIGVGFPLYLTNTIIWEIPVSIVVPLGLSKGIINLVLVPIPFSTPFPSPLFVLISISTPKGFVPVVPAVITPGEGSEFEFLMSVNLALLLPPKLAAVEDCIITATAIVLVPLKSPQCTIPESPTSTFKLFC